jgi:hypothetical protein
MALCGCGHAFANGGEPMSAGEAAAHRAGTVRTHYDNLKVARDAPPEVIRAAYRALSKKYHPDRRAEDVGAARVMQLLNAAYEVLSDPLQRKQHDDWIAQVEAARPAASETESSPYPEHAAGMDRGVRARAPRRAAWGLAASAVAAVLLAAAATGFYYRDRFGATAGGTAAVTAAAGRVAPAPGWPYVRGPLAPNGMPWPEASGYVEGYARLRTDGLLTVIVDNSRNRSDVFAKLVALDAGAAVGVRAMFVKAGERFAVERVRPGTYELRYRDLDAGVLSRSSPFILQELASEPEGASEDFSIFLPVAQLAGEPRPELSDSNF